MDGNSRSNDISNDSLNVCGDGLVNVTEDVTFVFLVTSVVHGNTFVR
jgi:hypothetical protein